MKIRRLLPFALTASILLCSCANERLVDVPAEGTSDILPETYAFESVETDADTETTSAPKTVTTPKTSETTTGGTTSASSAAAKETSAETVATESTTSQSEPITEITSGGTYTLSGEITNTMVIVDVGDADVNLILNGVTIKNSEGPAIFIRSGDEVTITLADGTVNTLSDGSSYSMTDSGSTLDGVIFSKADLEITGGGTLIVNANYKHGIVSKDDLVITSGTISVTSNKVGLNGKDCVQITGGDITVNAGSDGIRSDNEEDPTRGYVYIGDGTVNITAGNDGIQAETSLTVEAGNITVISGGGSSGSLTLSSESYKGLKAGTALTITGGTFNISSKDDCIHSNGTLLISGGDITLSSGDDGIHADTDLEITGESTKIDIQKSYEGIEAENLVISGGSISIVAADDGLNAAGGNNSVTDAWGRPGRGGFGSSTGTMTITGGDIYIKMGGDGVDSNGSLTMTGGKIIVSGAVSGDTSILDYDAEGIINGGTFIGTGSTMMAQNFSSSSTQGAILIATGNQSEGTAITLTDQSGNVIVSHTSDREFSCVIISCPGIVSGGTYTLTVGSSQMTITMNGTVYSSGGGGFGGGFGGGGFGGGKRGERW